MSWSSGALVAAIYDRYALKKLSQDDLTSQKLPFKKYFCYHGVSFHGQSSGLDPLNSYLSLPINHSKDNIEFKGILEQIPPVKGLFF